MKKEEAFETLKENLCGMCAYGSQNMESCDIRSCDNRDAIKALEQEHTPETVTEFADRCRECGKQKMDETKSVRDIIDEVKRDVCNKICKYPMEEGHEKDWLYKDNSPCMTCPLNRL